MMFSRTGISGLVMLLNLINRTLKLKEQLLKAIKNLSKNKLSLSIPLKMHQTERWSLNLDFNPEIYH